MPVVFSFAAVGANLTPMAWGEVYTALQTGVIDAVENPAEGLVSGGMQEVTNHLSRTLHIMTGVNLFANCGVMAGLTEDERTAVQASAATAVAEFNAGTCDASAQHGHTLARSGPVWAVRTLTEITVAILLSGYAAIIWIQVFYRYVLNDSLVWSEELVRYGLLWGVLLGAAPNSGRGAHIALEPLRSVLSAKQYNMVQWLAGLLIILFCLIAAWYGWEFASRLWHMPYVSTSIAVGCLLICFFTIVHLISGSYASTADPREGLS